MFSSGSPPCITFYRYCHADGVVLPLPLSVSDREAAWSNVDKGLGWESGDIDSITRITSDLLRDLGQITSTLCVCAFPIILCLLSIYIVSYLEQGLSLSMCMYST